MRGYGASIAATVAFLAGTFFNSLPDGGWGKLMVDPAARSVGLRVVPDADGDGVVGGSDYALWLNNFGEVRDASAVPESLTLSLLALGGAALIGRRRSPRRDPG